MSNERLLWLALFLALAFVGLCRVENQVQVLPHAVVTACDGERAPVAGARVLFYRVAEPDDGHSELVELYTDADGQVAIAERWQPVNRTIRAFWRATALSFEWCVDMPGKIPVLGRMGDFVDEPGIEAMLLPAPSASDGRCALGSGGLRVEGLPPPETGEPDRVCSEP